MPDIRKWLDELQNIWGILATNAGIWIITIATSFLLSLDAAFGDAYDIVSWMNKLSAFLTAVIIGLSFILSAILSKKKHTVIWVIITIVFAVASVGAVVKYNTSATSLACACNAQKTIRGSIYKDAQIIKRFYPQGFQCSDLCQNFIDQNGRLSPDKVWTEDSINQNRNYLIYSYLLCFPLIAITLISVCQAIYCYSRSPSDE